MSCQKDIKSVPTSAIPSKNDVQSETKTIATTKGDIKVTVFTYPINNPSSVGPEPPCSPLSTTDDEPPVRGPAYEGCCCLHFEGYGLPPIPGHPASILFTEKRYAWNQPTDYRLYVKIMQNGFPFWEGTFVDFADMPSCDNVFGRGIVFDDLCPGQVDFIVRKEYKKHSQGVWKYCTQEEGSFTCP